MSRAPRANGGYRIVRLVSGAHSVHSLAEAETFHPVVGPVAEAEALYVRQLHLVDRFRQTTEEFVVWDVGLGAAANPVTFLRAAAEVPGRIRVLSFDHTLEPLEFALRNVEHLDYLKGYEEPLQRLLREHHARFQAGCPRVEWSVRVHDFPSLLQQPEVEDYPKPHVIMFDAFSPAKNPAMWTRPLFSRIFQLLDPHRPCALPTYSRSTLLRVTLLLAGFFVGVGHATGEKEQTTIAANSLALVQQPLDRRWLERARRSTSAEPLETAVYRQAPLSETTWERLARHPQFR